MRGEGALRTSQLNIPSFIRHVIELTAQLNIPYLWIDKLCIVQDGGAEKTAQINKMNSIYAQAYVTIVAAEGSSASQLKGIRGITGPRSYRASSYVRSSEKGSDEEEVEVEYDIIKRRYSSDSIGAWHEYDQHELLNEREVLEDLTLKLMQTKWYHRAWTFQEQLFSRQKIVFHDDTVKWECPCAAYHETFGPVNSDDSDTLHEMGAKSLTLSDHDVTYYPDMYGFARLTSLHNKRQLRSPGDILDAFAGTLTAMSRSFKFGFVSGLPVLFFDAALLWQPWKPMTRRKAIHDRNLPDTGLAPQIGHQGKNSDCLPSWSWVGWWGTLHSESWRSAYAYMREDPDVSTNSRPISWKTFRTVEWFYVDDADQSHVIKSCDCSPSGVAELLELSDEWRTELDCYVNCNTGADQFQYPIPLRDPYKAHQPPVKSRFIRTRTQHTRVNAGETFFNLGVSECVCIDLHDPARPNVNIAIGFLRFPFDLSGSATLLRSKEHEVIELSSSEVYRQDSERIGFDEWDRLDWQGLGNVYRFVNVMLVSWKDAIGYREAIGRIEMSAWQHLVKESRDVMIG